MSRFYLVPSVRFLLDVLDVGTFCFLSWNGTLKVDPVWRYWCCRTFRRLQKIVILRICWCWLLTSEYMIRSVEVGAIKKVFVDHIGESRRKIFRNERKERSLILNRKST